MARTENGKAILRTRDGQKAVALDAIAKMSGVNLGAVSRVFAALRLVEKQTGMVVAELVDYESMPLAAPDEGRSLATNAFFKEVAELNYAEPEALFLRVKDRAATMH